MCDAWPDVRLPACIAARQILLASKSGSGIVEDKLLVDFLPYLCFNRLIDLIKKDFVCNKLYFLLNQLILLI